MSSSFLGAGGGGGGGASSAFFFGMAYGPTLSPGPPASAGTSCFGLPSSWVADEVPEGDDWEGVDAGGCPCWSCARTGTEAQSNTMPSTVANNGPPRFL